VAAAAGGEDVARRARSGAERARTFTWQATAERVDALLRRLRDERG
jgi:hypothetical protein